MANISIKKDFEDGQKLFAQQLNNNFETIELGINTGNKLIWKDDNGAEFQTFRGTTEEIENRPIIDGQTLYNIETGEMLLDTEDSRRTINKPLWNDNSTSEVTSFRGTTEEIEDRPIIDGQKLYDIENGDTFLDVGETRKVMNKPLWKDDNGAQVQSFRGTTAEVAARPIIDGQTLYNIETGETALDVGNNRISTGAGNVVYIGDEEPQNDATKIWIENDQVLNLGSEVAISPEEPTTQEKIWIQKGKNLFDKNIISRDCWINSSGGEDYSANSNDYISSYIECKANTSYTLSGYIGPETNYLVICSYDKNYQYIEHIFAERETTGTKTFVVEQDCYIRFAYGKGLSAIDNVQLEIGEVATEYEPYIPKKIHTKTANGYEEFYNEEEHNKVNYSTSEQRIGTWIDGKPLYRVAGIYSETIEEDTLTILASVGSGVIDKVTRYEVLSRINITVNNRSHEAPVYTSTGNFCIKPSTSIHEAIFVAEYTKTTD